MKNRYCLLFSEQSPWEIQKIPASHARICRQTWPGERVRGKVFFEDDLASFPAMIAMVELYFFYFSGLIVKKDILCYLQVLPWRHIPGGYFTVQSYSDVSQFWHQNSESRIRFHRNIQGLGSLFTGISRNAQIFDESSFANSFVMKTFV